MGIITQMLTDKCRGNAPALIIVTSIYEELEAATADKLDARVLGEQNVPFQPAALMGEAPRGR